MDVDASAKDTSGWTSQIRRSASAGGWRSKICFFRAKPWAEMPDHPRCLARRLASAADAHSRSSADGVGKTELLRGPTNFRASLSAGRGTPAGGSPMGMSTPMATQSSSSVTTVAMSAATKARSKRRLFSTTTTHLPFQTSAPATRISTSWNDHACTRWAVAGRLGDLVDRDPEPLGDCKQIRIGHGDRLALEHLERAVVEHGPTCLLYTSPSPRDR